MEIANLPRFFKQLLQSLRQLELASSFKGSLWKRSPHYHLSFTSFGTRCPFTLTFIRITMMHSQKTNGHGLELIRPRWQIVKTINLPFLASGNILWEMWWDYPASPHRAERCNPWGFAEHYAVERSPHIREVTSLPQAFEAKLERPEQGSPGHGPQPTPDHWGLKMMWDPWSCTVFSVLLSFKLQRIELGSCRL